MIENLTTVRLWAGTELADGIASLMPEMTSGEVTLVPSSLSRRDALMAALRATHRASGGKSRVLLPANPVAALARRGDWCDVTIAVPDGEPRRVRLPAELIAADQLWTITDVSAVSGRGPYVLDVLARYLAPADRLRLLGGSARSAAAEVTLARRPDFCLLAWRGSGGYVMVATSDVVAAELLALSLVDEDLLEEHRLTGPWEDALVQRATELELGVRLPQELQVDVVPGTSDAFSDTLARILSRIGVLVG